MLEILIVGAVSSAIYAMLAVGFTLIFGVARILNLAHGSFYALGAYGAYFFTTHLKLPLLPAALLAVAVVAISSALIMGAPATIMGVTLSFNPGPAIFGAASVPPSFVEPSYSQSRLSSGPAWLNTTSNMTASPSRCAVSTKCWRLEGEP